MDPFIQNLIGGGVVGGVIAALALLGNTLLTRKTMSPAERAQAETARATAESAANDLILKLLDRANTQIASFESLLGKSISEEAAEQIREERDRAIAERDRLILAIRYLTRKAEKTGQLTYAEVLTWASHALDPDIPISDFDAALAAVSGLSSEFENTHIPE